MRWVPYQQRFIADRSPRVVVVKARRIGFSEALSFVIASRAMGVEWNVLHGEPRRVRGVTQNIISASFRQATGLLARVAKHVRVMAKLLGVQVLRDNITEIELSTGVKLMAFSSNPKTIRGEEGDINLDEFAFVPNQDELWQAIKPLADRTLGNKDGYQIRIVSTPFGDDDRFFRIVRGDLKDKWSIHSVDIHQAIRDGFPIEGTIEDFKLEAGDEETWAQEYECSFLAASSRFISAELYDVCLYDDIELPRHLPSTFFAGIDVARKRDRTAVVTGERKLDTLWHSGTHVARDMPWDEQEAWVDGLIARCSRVGVDATGMGSQFAERMGARWPGRIEPVDFTTASKEVLATGLRLALERHKLRLMRDDVDLRREVLSMRREVTPFGNMRFDVERTTSGHGDRAWALALALSVSGGAAKEVSATPRAHTLPRAAPGRLERPARGGWR